METFTHPTKALLHYILSNHLPRIHTHTHTHTCAPAPGSTTSLAYGELAMESPSGPAARPRAACREGGWGIVSGRRLENPCAAAPGAELYASACLGGAWGMLLWRPARPRRASPANVGLSDIPLQGPRDLDPPVRGAAALDDRHERARRGHERRV